MINTGKPCNRSVIMQIGKLSVSVGANVRFYENVRIWICKEIVRAASYFKKFDVRIERAIERLAEMQDKREYLHVVTALARMIDENNPYAYGHSENVLRYSLRICKRLKLPKDQTEIIKTASQLHDIGKISINVAVLRKAEPLTADDWRAIRNHPVIGADIIEQAGFLSEVVPIIRHHHERYSGGGYPDGNMKNSGIPIGSRIIAVADAFDAMTNERPYRKVMTKEEAVAELRRCAGYQFDPEVVNVFLR